MELQTLFKRESVADPFSIRIMQIHPTPSNNSGVSSVPYQWSETGGLENRFQRNCRFKNGGALRRRKNIPSLPPAFDMYLIVSLVYLIHYKYQSIHVLSLHPIHQIQVRYLVQVPVHQASSDPESGRPSARCWGWGKVVRYKTSLPPKKIAQVLKEEDQRTLSCTKWSWKLYLKGKV
jgi:hypothetical protein